MNHPCAALSARHPLKGAMLAARQSRFCGILGWDNAHRAGDSQSLAAKALGLGGGHITGMLRVEAVSHRRASAPLGRARV